MEGIEHNQFVSMQSLSSTSSISNNENVDRHHKKTSSKNHNQIYDSLNNHHNKKSNKNRQQLILKDLNADDTATETESLINAFDDMRMIHQQNHQQHHHRHHHPIASSKSSTNMNGKRSSTSSHKPTHIASFSKLIDFFSKYNLNMI